MEALVNVPSILSPRSPPLEDLLSRRIPPRIPVYPSKLSSILLSTSPITFKATHSPQSVQKSFHAALPLQYLNTVPIMLLLYEKSSVWGATKWCHTCSILLKIQLIECT